ncbi:Transposase [Enhygromyxa salina]|uniref:Transposase n=1 Tax=Enhygromyxa salina TaxID=215803 RepID=A0A0C2D0W7_9BACT|nr:Rpn family recombination-promoting nuclease/putative transposase [Enhygromyxa salina]KIG13782.1 Transposase [Enhygromyxa salina]
MTNTPHDALFKAAFEHPEHARGIFRSILPTTLADAISWDTVTAQPGSFIADDLAATHSDLLFSVQIAGKPAFLYLLLEHQSTSDFDMPIRMLASLIGMWKRHRKQHGGPLPLVVAIVVTHAPDGWNAPVSFHSMFDPPPGSIPGLAELVPDFSLLVVDLNELDDDTLKARALASFPKLALWLLRDGRDARDADNAAAFKRQLLGWFATFRDAYKAPNGVEALAQLFRYIALVVGDVRFDDFRAMIHEQLPEAEEVAMTIAEELHEKGMQQGMQQGRAETLEKLMTAKFGELPPSCIAQIAEASEKQLVAYIDRFLTATTIEAVFANTH